MQKYILTVLVACICTYTNAQDSSFSFGKAPSADTTKPIIETVPRTQANEAQATQPLGTTTTTTTTSTTTTQPTNDYGEVYSEAIKTKEGYWVIGISPTFTEPPAGVQGAYTLGYGNGTTSTTTTTSTAADTYTPAPTYTAPVTTTYTPAPTYTNNVVSSGKMYRLQLSATKKYRAERYQKLLDLGSIVLEDTETDKGKFTRVLLDGFYTLEDARRALATVKERGNERAFIAVYDNGVRQKAIYRK